MGTADERRPSAKAVGDDKDDLFGKLDQLISRHQSAARPPGSAAVPTLTEAVDQQAPVAESQIPILSEAVEVAPAREEWPGADRRRQLQVALYLRLRQRLDRELGAAAPNREPPGPGKPESELARVVHALRNALPAIIRESVDQVFGSDRTTPR